MPDVVAWEEGDVGEVLCSDGAWRVARVAGTRHGELLWLFPDGLQKVVIYATSRLIDDPAPVHLGRTAVEQWLDA